MNALNFTLAREKCTRCGSCINDCPRKIIRAVDGYPAVAPETEELCIRCQHCFAICPAGAISVFGLNPENSLPVEKTPAVSADAMSRFVRARRTTRQYEKENVERGLIDRLLADTAYAPTGGNRCDLIFSVSDNRQNTERLLHHLLDGLEQKLKDTGGEPPAFISNAIEARRTGHDEIFRGAPHLLIVSAGEKAYCGDADVIIALSYFELLAQSHGLGTTWCGFLKFIFDFAPELAGAFGINLDRPYYAMLFGHPAVSYARTVQRDDAAAVKTLDCRF